MKRYFTLLFIMVALVMGIRSIFVGKAIWTNWQRENYWLKKANTAEKYDVIFLGDSRINHAVNPTLFLKSLDKKALNYAFPSISYTPYYLQKAKSIFAPNASVLLGLSAESLTLFQADDSLRAYERSGPICFHQLLSLTRAFWPQINLQPVLKTGKIPWAQLIPQSHKDLYHANGWVEGSAPAMTDFRSMAHHYRELAERFQIDRPMVNNLLNEVRSWTANGNKVHFFWVCFDGIVCKEEEKILNEVLKKEIETGLLASGAYKLSFEGVYGTFDGDHLTGPEALRFSEDLARIYNTN